MAKVKSLPTPIYYLNKVLFKIKYKMPPQMNHMFRLPPPRMIPPFGMI